MPKLVKRGDTYKPDKLKASIMKAGASEETASEIVESTKVTEGMPTLMLRKQVLEKLRFLDSKAAERYETYRKA